MKKKQEPNLVKVYEELTPTERSVLCGLINMQGMARTGDSPPHPDMHHGVLPFFKQSEALRLVDIILQTAEAGRGLRIFKQIKAKLLENRPADEATFKLHLNDIKVYRRFGRRPELGKPMPWLQKIKVTVGMKNQFGRVSPDTDVLVAPTVALRRVRPGYWRVATLARCQHDVETWLVENCR